MNAAQEPTRDQLLAMAYVDGELDEAELRAFETRLAREPELAFDVTQNKRLELLARQLAPPEPEDHEWRRIEGGMLHRTGMDLGWNLILFGLVGIYLFVLLRVVVGPLPLVLKALLTALLIGFGILFLLVLRKRMRTRRFDPYTDIRR